MVTFTMFGVQFRLYLLETFLSVNSAATENNNLSFNALLLEFMLTFFPSPLHEVYEYHLGLALHFPSRVQQYFTPLLQHGLFQNCGGFATDADFNEHLEHFWYVYHEQTLFSVDAMDADFVKHLWQSPEICRNIHLHYADEVFNEDWDSVEPWTKNA